MTAQPRGTACLLRRPPSLALLLALLFGAVALPVLATTSVTVVNPQPSENISAQLLPTMYLVNGIAYDADSVNVTIDALAPVNVPVKRGVWEFAWDLSNGAVYTDGSTHTITVVGVKKGVAQTNTEANPAATSVAIERLTTRPSGGLTLIPSSVDSGLYLNAGTIGGKVNVQYRGLARLGQNLTTIKYGETSSVVNSAALVGDQLNNDSASPDLRVSFTFDPTSTANFRALFARFVDNGTAGTPVAGNTSLLYQRRILVDSVLPTVDSIASTVTQSGGGPRVILSGTAHDPNTAPVAPGGNAISGIADIKILAVRVKDVSGTTIATPGPGDYLVIPAQITSGATAGATITWQAQFPDANNTTLLAGTYNFTVIATDNAGNASDPIADGNNAKKTGVVINAAPPTAALTAPTALNGFVRGLDSAGAAATVPLQIVVGDPTALKDWNITEGGTQIAGTSVSKTYTLLSATTTDTVTAQWDVSAQGATSTSHTLTLTVDDFAGNTTTTTLTVTVDKLAETVTVPVVTATGTGIKDPTSGYFSGDAKINATISGGNLVGWQLLDGATLLASDATGTVTDPNFTWHTKTAATDGSHVLTLTATYKAGNAVTKTTTVTTDNTPPTALITSLKAGDLVPIGTHIQATIGDNIALSGWTLAYNGTPLTSGTYTVAAAKTSDAIDYVWDTTNFNGTHNLVLTVTDYAGNTATATLSLVTDNGIPLVTPSAPAANAYVANPVAISGAISGTAHNSLVQWNVFDGAAPSPLSLTGDATHIPLFSAPKTGDFSALQLPTLAPGTHTLTFVAKSATGFFSATQTTLVINVDTLNAPVITAPSPGAYITGRDAAGAALAKVLITATATTAIANDPITLHVMVDGKDLPPTVAAGDHTMDFSPLSNGQVSWDVLNFPTAAGAANLNDGQHTITAYITNNAGQRGPLSTPVTVTVDSTKPVVSVVNPANGATVAAGAPLVGVISDANPSLSAASVHFNYAYGATTGTIPVTLDSTGRTATAVGGIPSQFAGNTVAITLTATDLAGNTNTSAAVSITVPGATNLLNHVDTLVQSPLDGSFSPRVNSPSGAFLRGVINVFGTVSPNNLVGWKVNLYNVADLANAAAVPALVINGSGTGPQSAALLGSANTAGGSGVSDGSYYLRLDVTTTGGTVIGTTASNTAALVTVDNTLPTIANADVSGLDGTFFNNTAFLNGVAHTPPSIVGTSSDANPFKTYLFVDNALYPDSNGTAGTTVTQSTSGLSQGPHTFGFVAVDKAGNRSTPLTAKTFAIDNAPPTAQITSPISGTTVTANTPIIGSVTDANPPATVTFTLNIGAATQDFIVPLTNGAATLPTPPTVGGVSTTGQTITVTLKATDKAGNTAPNSVISVSVINPQTGILEIDDTVLDALNSPKLNQNNPLPSVTYIRALFDVYGVINVQNLKTWTAGVFATATSTTELLHVGDGTTNLTSFSKLNAAQIDSTKKNDATALPDGAYVLRIDTSLTTDAPGAPLNQGAPVNIVIDNTPPTTTSILPVLPTAATVSLSGVSFTFSGLFFDNAASPQTLAGTASDANTLPTNTVTAYVLVDNTLYATGTPGTPAGSPATLAASVSKATTGLTEGVHTFSVVAIDKAGNRTASPDQTFPFTVDNTPPSVSLATPIEAIRNASDGLLYLSSALHPNVTLTGSTTDTNLAGWTLTDGGVLLTSPAKGTGPFSGSSAFSSASLSVAGLGDGPHTLRLSAVDKANHLQSASAPLRISGKVGSLANLLPADGVIFNNSVTPITIRGDFTGALYPDQMSILIDGADRTGTPNASPVTSIARAYTIADLMEGTHTFVIHAVDKAGNVTESTPRTLIIDKTPPTIQNLTVTPSVVSSQTSSFATPASNTNGGSILAVAGNGLTVSATLSDNTTDSRNTVAWGIQLFQVASNKTTLQSIAFPLRNDYLSVSGGNTAAGPALAPFASPGQSQISARFNTDVLPNGNYVFVVSATDQAGNVAASAKIEIQVANNTGVVTGNGLPSATLLVFAIGGIPSLTPTLQQTFEGAGSLLGPNAQSVAGVTNPLVNLNYPNPSNTGMYDQYGNLLNAAFGTLPDSKHPFQTLYTNTEFIVEASVFQSVNATLSEPTHPVYPGGSPANFPIPSLSSSASNQDNPPAPSLGNPTPKRENLDNFSAPFTYSLSRTTEGLYQYVLIAADVVNKSATPALLNVVLDRKNPTLTINLPSTQQVQTYSPGDILVLDFVVAKPSGLAPIKRIQRGVNAPFCNLQITALNAASNPVGSGVSYTLLDALNHPTLQDTRITNDANQNVPSSGAAVVTGDAFGQYHVRWQIRLFSQNYSAGVAYRISLNNLQDVTTNAVTGTTSVRFQIGN